MATIRGTSGPDVFELTTNDTYEALEGDDKVTVKGRWGTVQPGQGNDTVIIDQSVGNDATVWYWSSPAAITVDLEAGYALDGWGTRDTLVNVHRVHGFKQPGDKGYGSQTSDWFWVDAWRGTQKGSIFIDGRGGFDELDFRVDETANRGKWVFEVSADGRTLTSFFESVPTFTFEFRNIERINVRSSNNSITTVLDVANLASFDKAGQDVLLRGAAGWQTNAPGAATTITYSFLTERPPEGAEGGTGFATYSAAQQKIVRDLFAKLQEQTGVTFREVAGSTGDIRFGINQQADTRGYSFIPDFFRGKAQAGDVWLDVESAAVMNPGQEGYYALLHEVGHALGLQHPLGESDTSGAVVLLDRFASLSNTVMVDRSHVQTGGLWPNWFGAMDMQALRFLYGNKSVSTGADRYMVADLASKSYSVILDDGGDDTLDASTSGSGVTLDLRPGWLSSVGADAGGEPLRHNLSLGVGTVIETAVGSPYDDLIIGSDAPNRLQGNGGSDILDGNGGLDWAIFKGGRAGWILEPLPGTANWFVSARDGISGAAEVRRMERVRFDDKAVAFDLTKNDNAGKALLLIGAVLGRDATLSKAALLGQVIDLFDQGFTMQQLAGAVMRLPIWGGVLTPTNSPEDVARYLLKLNKGAEPTAAEVATAAQAISGQVQGTYLATLALTDANVAKIDLVGLATTGFEYPIGG
ncbi:MAG: M10 family metallopeptidase [Betaproteobacteria bacterium]